MVGAPGPPSATTGVRRGELCALRRKRDIDWDRGVATVAWNLIDLNGRPLSEAMTKNRRIRRVALDDRTLQVMREQVGMMEARALAAGTELLADAYLFSDAADGAEPWRPRAVTMYFARLRSRAGLDHLNLHSLRKFMETYGQDPGFSPVQVAMRAGHDPVAAKHYTGKLAESDRGLAEAVSALKSSLTPGRRGGAHEAQRTPGRLARAAP